MRARAQREVFKLGDRTQGTVGWYPPLHHKSEYNSVFFRIEFIVPLFDGTMVPRGIPP
jgi:hypothetical protein